MLQRRVLFFNIFKSALCLISSVPEIIIGNHRRVC